jgi:hypothetical protein
LFIFYKKLGQHKGPFEILNVTSLSFWFTIDGVLWNKFRIAIEVELAYVSFHSCCPHMLERRPELKQEIMSLLKSLKKARQVLSR